MQILAIAVIALIFAGCKQNKKASEEEIKKGVNEMFSNFKKSGATDKTLAEFVEGYDKLDANNKQKLQEAFTGKEFKIAKIEGDQVTADISFTPSDGGQLIVKTVIFKVIQVDGKIRVKDLVNVIDNGNKATTSGPDENVVTNDENDLTELPEEHD